MKRLGKVFIEHQAELQLANLPLDLKKWIEEFSRSILSSPEKVEKLIQSKTLDITLEDFDYFEQKFFTYHSSQFPVSIKFFFVRNNPKKPNICNIRTR